MRRIAVALLAVLLVASCGADSGTDAGYVAAKPGYVEVPVADRVQAPKVDGELLDGKTWSSDTVSGKVIVYNVWGSWCAPCRKEAPELVEAAKQTSKIAQFVGINTRDLDAAKQTADIAQFVGINTRDLDAAPARAFVRSFNIKYPNLYDPGGEQLLRFKNLPASAIPTTLIIDRKGRLAARFIGEVDAKTLVEAVTSISEQGE